MTTAGDIVGLVDSHIKGLGFGPADGHNFGRLADRTDPTAGLRGRYPWLSAKLERLTKPLEEIEGQPARITAYAETWRKLGNSAEQTRSSLKGQVEALTGGWKGPASADFASFMQPQDRRLSAISAGSAAIADVATAGGEVVADFRFQIFEIARKACIKLAKKIPEWLLKHGGDPAGKAAVAGLVAGAVAAVLVILYKLLTKLKAALDALKGLLQKIKSIMEGLGGRAPKDDGRHARPTLPPDENRKPKGQMEPYDPNKKRDRNKKIQEDIANQAAKDGYDIEHWDKPHPTKSGNPDYKVGDKFWDAYVAESPNDKKIFDEIKKKAKDQGEVIVLALPDGNGGHDEEKAQRVLDQLRKRADERIEEVKIWKDGKIQDFYP